MQWASHEQWPHQAGLVGLSARLMFTLVIWDPGVGSTCTMAHKMQSTHPERTRPEEGSGNSLMRVWMATDCIPPSTRGHGQKRAQGDSLMRVWMATDCIPSSTRGQKVSNRAGSPVQETPAQGLEGHLEPSYNFNQPCFEGLAETSVAHGTWQASEKVTSFTVACEVTLEPTSQ